MGDIIYITQTLQWLPDVWTLSSLEQCRKVKAVTLFSWNSISVMPDIGFHFFATGLCLRSSFEEVSHCSILVYFCALLLLFYILVCIYINCSVCFLLVLCFLSVNECSCELYEYMSHWPACWELLQARWKMIILPILITSLIHFFLKGWENVLFELGTERVKGGT